MSGIVPLHFDEFDVRAIVIEDEPWWVGIDITRMLGIVDGHQALDRLEDYERGGGYNIPTPSGDQEMIVINESGLYSLLLTSRKPIARTFKRWLTMEVIPSIRKHGTYPPPTVLDRASLPSPEPKHEEWEKPPATRFFEECVRVFGALSDRELERVLQHVVSAASLRQIRIGNGLRKALNRDETWLRLMGMGFDLLYIMQGRRALTREEREMVANLRKLDEPARALAFHRIRGQIGSLQID